MDFQLDWNSLFEVLATVVVVAMLVERLLALIFENRYWIERIQGKGIHVKELIAFAVSLGVCIAWKFDALSLILHPSDPSPLPMGYVVTAGVIAGGGKGSVKLFRDVLGFKSTARIEQEQLRSTSPRTVDESYVSRQGGGS